MSFLLDRRNLPNIFQPSAVSKLNHPLEKKKLNPLDARLMQAATKGDNSLVKSYVERGADVNCHHFDRVTPLAIAAERDDELLAHFLLNNPSIFVDFQDMEGNTPLQIAVKMGQVNVARLLLRYGADVNRVDPMGRTALHSAVFESNVDMARNLIRNGAKVNAADAFGDVPLHMALLYAPSPDAARLLLRNGCTPNARITKGLGIMNETALEANEDVMVKVVYMLVRQGASVNMTEPIGKRTPLHMAAFLNNVELADYLLSSGADVNAETRDGKTPLALALSYRSWEVADVLETHFNSQSPGENYGSDSEEDLDGVSSKVALILNAVRHDLFLETGIEKRVDI